MGPSDSRTGQIEVMCSPGLLAYATRVGLPGSSTDLSVRAVPYHPGKSDGCTCPFLHHRWQACLRRRQAGFALSGRLATLQVV